MGRRLTKTEIRRIGKEFSKVVSAEFVSRHSRSYPANIARLRRIQKDYCKRLSMHPEFARELKRRIAEALLELTIFRSSRMRACRARFKSLTKVGFTDIERKGHFHLIYARAALARGHRKIARKVARRMIQELNHALAKEKSLLGAKILGHLQALLSEL